MSPRLTWQETRPPTHAGTAGGVWLFTYTRADDRKHPGEPWVVTTVLPGFNGKTWRGADEAQVRDRAALLLDGWLRRIGGGVMTLFWVITLQWFDADLARMKTVKGRLTPAEAVALETRQAAFAAILGDARRDAGVPHDVHPAVLFFSLEKDALTAVSDW